MLSLHLSKAQYRKNIWLLSKPCHVGIHLKALRELYQKSTKVPVIFKNFQILFCSN